MHSRQAVAVPAHRQHSASHPTEIHEEGQDATAAARTAERGGAMTSMEAVHLIEAARPVLHLGVIPNDLSGWVRGQGLKETMIYANEERAWKAAVELLTVRMVVAR